MKDRALTFELPKVASVADLPAGFGAIMEAVAAGEILPSEGQAVAAMLAQQRQAFETVSLAERMAEIERRLEET